MMPPTAFDKLPADDEEAIAQMTAVKGIGRWTAEIFLLFTRGRPDVLALDDLGSGVCSLRNLTDFPIARVKLDELVTSYVADDPLQRNFVRMVVNLCRARGIRTVAEWTKTIEQMQRLAEDGVDLFQGELLGMPMPPADSLPPRTPPKAHA
jgi:EAL domain-containing protein (putative c-di-GMP-specific phosphodiesterase class I)